MTEALLRAKFKFPGRQSIHISKNWGFTKFKAGEFENIVAEKQLIPNGSKVKYIPPSGHMAGLALMRALMPSPPYSCPPINPSCLSKKKEKMHLSSVISASEHARTAFSYKGRR